VAERPRGTVTFLFTDFEGSTRLLRLLRDRYGAVLAEQQRLLRHAFAAHGGEVVDSQGDALFCVFSRARDAAAAAVDAQRALAAHSWPEGAKFRVRMGMHTGEPVLSAEGRYHGLGVHRAARIMASGHGGQVLASQASASLLADDELEGIELRDLGEHRLRDLDRPERIYQLEIERLDRAFPRLRTAAWVRAETEPPAGPVVAPPGRDAEHAVAVRFLVALAEGPRGLLIAGEAGIGKTIVWEAALGEACRRSYVVLSFRAAASERQLSFAGLGDLLDGVLTEVLSRLATPQRRALEAALGVAEVRSPPESRLIGLALLNGLRALAVERPLVVAIDDLQWLDEPSGQLLGFALRRLQDEPVGLLASVRAGPGAAAPFELERGLAERLERLVIGPLSLGALQRLLRTRLAAPLPGPLVRRIHEHSGGNLFYALELARAFAERGGRSPPSGGQDAMTDEAFADGKRCVGWSTALGRSGSGCA
jgi:class 3 adenylate cyclase